MSSNATVLKMPEGERKSVSHAIVSRQADFWLLGGASIFFFAFLILANLLINRSMRVTGHLLALEKMFATLTLFVNYPHFIISYKFGYGRGRAFITSHWFSLIFVPFAMVAVMAISFFALDGTFQGIKATNGTAILSWSLVVMGLSVGWHYLKQVFGCMMVYARYDNYPIDQKQRRILLTHLYLLGALNFTYMAVRNAKFLVLEIPRIQLSFPTGFFSAVYILTAISFVMAVYFICYKNYKEKALRPSLNFLTPWIAFLLWFVPLSSSLPYFWLAIPFFHSLQYLPFAYRLETAQESKFSLGFLKVAGICLIGFLFFEGLPELADKLINSESNFHLLFFFAATNIFLNIHHYFIDSVVWKFKDPEVRNSLF